MPLSRRRRTVEAAIRAVRASADVVPTDAPEANGTFAWDRTTLVVAEIEAGGETGLGHTYTHASAADLVNRTLGPEIQGGCALDIPARTDALWRRVRNIGRSGHTPTAISALDVALWDLEAKLRSS